MRLNAIKTQLDAAKRRVYAVKRRLDAVKSSLACGFFYAGVVVAADC